MKVQPELWVKGKRRSLLLPLLALIGCRPEPVPSMPAGHMPPQAPSGHAAKPGACDVQDGVPLPHLRLRAIGTEPFWGARIEGRCVTYSHPDDQSGTRVWTKFSAHDQGGTWSGALLGKPFVLRTRRQQDCSDGMSDRLYPLAVTLTVNGEERQGCAEPL